MHCLTFFLEGLYIFFTTEPIKRTEYYHFHTDTYHAIMSEWMKQPSLCRCHLTLFGWSDKNVVVAWCGSPVVSIIVLLAGGLPRLFSGSSAR
jgi:hypothetical protein